MESSVIQFTEFSSPVCLTEVNEECKKYDRSASHAPPGPNQPSVDGLESTGWSGSPSR